LFLRILILASDVFYHGSDYDGETAPASLFDAYDLIKDAVGQCEYELWSFGNLPIGPDRNYHH